MGVIFNIKNQARLAKDVLFLTLLQNWAPMI